MKRRDFLIPLGNAAAGWPLAIGAINMQRLAIFGALAGLLVFNIALAIPAKAQHPTYCVWRGTAPFCSGDCEAGEEGLERTANPPEAGGDSCLTGTKILCCRYPAAAPGEIRSSVNNKCLDADLGTIGSNGTKVQLWDCVGGLNQKWFKNRNSTIVNAQSRRCLDADLNTLEINGAKVQLWDCLGGNNQLWGGGTEGEGFPSGDISKLFTTGLKCLDADTNTLDRNGTKVQLWDCLNGQNQKWINEIVSLTNDDKHRCLDADLGTIGGNGTRVQLWDCWGGQNQRWMVNGDGAIVNVQSNRCLDADLNTIGGNGTKLQLWDCWGGQNQKWNRSGNQLRNAQSNACLDGDTNTIDGNGTKVQLWQCLSDSQTNQHWEDLYN